MLTFKQQSNTYSSSIPNLDYLNIYNDFGTTTSIVPTNSTQFENESFDNLTDHYEITTSILDNNKTVISNELNLKYSLIFIIDFQVILFNALIIAHLLKAKSFQKSSSARYFVLSLAVSDILVGILVMPLGIISLMVNRWLFGKLFCELWQVMDFFVCTASIFNLCTVSIDRYIAISKPLIYMKMSNTRVCVIIVLVWLASALITFPPMIAERLGFIKDVCKAKPDCRSCESLFDLVPVYVVFATISSFFLPVLLVIVTNYRTYLIVKRHMFARTNNGRISLPTNKQKPKKLKFFVDLLSNKKDKNRSIELNSFENQQKNKSSTVPKKLSPNDPQFVNNSCCCCEKELQKDQSYLQTSTSLASQSLFCARFSKCFNWLLNRDCSTIDSKIVESKIITTHLNQHYSSCSHHHCHSDHDLASLSIRSENESNKCTAKLSQCLVRCCTLNGQICNLSTNNRQSTKFSGVRAFFFPNNSSNAQILDTDMTNSNNNNLNNIRSCTHCALNSLNALYRTNQTNHHQTRNEQLFSNEELLVDEESTSGSKNRQESASVSILVNSRDSNDEIMNENSSNFNEKNLVDSSNTLNNSINSVMTNNHLPNGCLMNSRCNKEFNLNCNKGGSNCCAYCGALCSECSNCHTDFNRMLDIFKKSNQIKKSKDSKSNSTTKIAHCTKSISGKQSGNQQDKLCKPQHHLNCAHFKNNQLLTNYNKMTLIRCDHCGHTLLQDQTKTLCLHRLAHPHQLTKNSKKDHQLCLSSHQQNLKYSHKSNHAHHHHHHCLHCQQHYIPRQPNNSIYTEPMSSESNRPESTHSLTNSGEMKDENPPSTSSDYKRTNKTSNSSFDDELRINCGTGQLQKSIGFFPTANKSQTGNSSTNSDNKSAKLKLKRFAHYAGNSVRNVASLGNSRANKLNTIRREYKATKTLATITFVFILMWTPYYLIFLLQTVCADCFLFKNFASHFWHQTLWLGWSNSYVNCLIYIYFSRKLRNSIFNSLFCRKS